MPTNEIRQTCGTGVTKDGQPYSFFHDHFGPDFDLYICQSASEPYEEQPEDPRELPRLLRREQRTDCKQEKYKPLGISLRDVSSDGKVYLRSR